MRLKRAQIGEIRLASGQIVRQLHRLRNFAKLCVCRLLLMWISPMQFIPMQLQNPAVQFLHCHPRDIRDFLAFPEPYKMLSSAPRDVFPLYAANTSPNRLTRRELDLAE